MPRMKIEIDRDLCIGVGDCVRVAPSAFALDDDAIAHVLDAGSVDELTLRDAEAICPSGAIRVTVVDDAAA